MRWLIALAFVAACSSPTQPASPCGNHGDTVTLAASCTDSIVVVLGGALPYQRAVHDTSCHLYLLGTTIREQCGDLTSYQPPQ